MLQLAIINGHWVIHISSVIKSLFSLIVLNLLVPLIVNMISLCEKPILIFANFLLVQASTEMWILGWKYESIVANVYSSISAGLMPVIHHMKYDGRVLESVETLSTLKDPAPGWIEVSVGGKFVKPLSTSLYSVVLQHHFSISFFWWNTAQIARKWGKINYGNLENDHYF